MTRRKRKELSLKVVVKVQVRVVLLNQKAQKQRVSQCMTSLLKKRLTSQAKGKYSKGQTGHIFELSQVVQGHVPGTVPGLSQYCPRTVPPGQKLGQGHVPPGQNLGHGTSIYYHMSSTT